MRVLVQGFVSFTNAANASSASMWRWVRPAYLRCMGEFVLVVYGVEFNCDRRYLGGSSRTMLSRDVERSESKFEVQVQIQVEGVI